MSLEVFCSFKNIHLGVTELFFGFFCSIIICDYFCDFIGNVQGVSLALKIPERNLYDDKLIQYRDCKYPVKFLFAFSIRTCNSQWKESNKQQIKNFLMQHILLSPDRLGRKNLGSLVTREARATHVDCVGSFVSILIQLTKIR